MPKVKYLGYFNNFNSRKIENNKKGLIYVFLYSTFIVSSIEIKVCYFGFLVYSLNLRIVDYLMRKSESEGERNHLSGELFSPFGENIF